MISISASDSKAIDLLIRNPTARYTIRNIAQKIGITAAGAHRLLRLMEEEGILNSEKLGSGIFYEINLENNTAKYLCAFVLSQSCKEETEKFSELKKHSLFALKLDNELYVVIDPKEQYKANELIGKLQGKAVIDFQEDFSQKLKKKDSELLKKLSTAKVMWGELNLIDIIKEVY